MYVLAFFSFYVNPKTFEWTVIKKSILKLNTHVCLSFCNKVINSTTLKLEVCPTFLPNDSRILFHAKPKTNSTCVDITKILILVECQQLIFDFFKIQLSAVQFNSQSKLAVCPAFLFLNSLKSLSNLTQEWQ